MAKKIYENGVVVFSMLIGFLSFFSLVERRTNAAGNKIFSKSEGESIRNDFLAIGYDLKKSFSKMTS